MPDDNLVYDLEGSDPLVKKPKVLLAGDYYDDQPFIVATEDEVALVGSRTSVVSVGDKFGIGLSGPVSISAMPNELSFAGGYWKLDPRHLATLASTTPTPIPLLTKATPGLLRSSKDVTDSVSFMESVSDIAGL